MDYLESIGWNNPKVNIKVGTSSTVLMHNTIYASFPWILHTSIHANNTFDILIKYECTYVLTVPIDKVV